MTELTAMPVRAKTALAASAAERLNDGGLVRRALDAAWAAAGSGAFNREDASNLFERCVDLIPKLDGLPGSAYADDAIAAAAYAVQSGANLDPRAAGWACRRVLDAIDTFLLNTAVDPNHPEVELKVWEHELVQLELRRREEDRAALADSVELASAVEALRSRSAELPALPIDRLHVSFRGAD
jgi:hypothetical protein